MYFLLADAGGIVAAVFDESTIPFISVVVVGIVVTFSVATLVWLRFVTPPFHILVFVDKSTSA